MEDDMRNSDFELRRSDILRFQNNPKKLHRMVLDRKYNIDIKKGFKNVKSSYAFFESECNISETLFSKIINGTRAITREFLYKFAVGLHMTVEEANEFFVLKGGILDENDLDDCICLRALEEKNTIQQYLEEVDKNKDLKPRSK